MHLFPRAWKIKACFFEGRGFAEQCNGVHRRGQTIDLIVIAAGVENGLVITLSEDVQVSERFQCSGRCDLLKVWVIQKQHVRKGP